MKVEVKGLEKVIKGATVLDGVDLSLEGGRVYGLRGKNGSGKTMLMRAIVDAAPPGSAVDVTVADGVLACRVEQTRRVDTEIIEWEDAS